MDLTNSKPLIVSVGIGDWYPAGIDRLERSLNFNGYGGDAMLFKTYPEGSPSHKDNPYAFKIYAIKQGLKMGYTKILYVDSSFWCVKNPMPVFDYINDNGLFMFKTGYSLADTASDRLLDYTNEVRENLVDVSEFAGGCIGLNIDNPNGKMYFDLWWEYCQAGLYKGNRSKDEADSKHPLFKFSRQDQSASSMALHKMGVKNINAPEWVAYYRPNYDTKDLTWFIGGL